MLAPADQPPDDILEYVVVDTDKTGQIRKRQRSTVLTLIYW